MQKTKYTVLDLFCGCGGLSLGFEKAGYNVLLGIDVWEDALTTYKYNHKNSDVLCADLSTLSPDEVNTKHKKKKIDIIGGPHSENQSL